MCVCVYFVLCISILGASSLKRTGLEPSSDANSGIRHIPVTRVNQPAGQSTHHSSKQKDDDDDNDGNIAIDSLPAIRNRNPHLPEHRKIPVTFSHCDSAILVEPLPHGLVQVLQHSEAFLVERVHTAGRDKPSL